jgi:hypothetical protein
LSLFDLCQIPIYTKFLVGPILDRFYSRKIGKRMTYIIPISIILVGYFWYLSAKAESLLMMNNGVGLVVPLFIGMALVSI